MGKNYITRVVINKSSGGGLYLSPEAVEWLQGHGFMGQIEPDKEIPETVVPRHDNLLVGCVACLGVRACGVTEYAGRKVKADLAIATVDSPFYAIIRDETGAERVIDLSSLTDATGGRLVADVVTVEEYQRRKSIPEHEKDVVWKFEPDRVWFTSDTHFGHDNIIKYCNRPFRDVREMNEELIRRWNETVPEDGVVFHLGDFGYGGSKEWADILRRLNGMIYLILGNHDLKNIKPGYLDSFAHVSQQMTIRVGGQSIYMNHNPFLCYGGSYKDVWQLFGHVHSGPNSNTGLDHPRLQHLFPLQYDVGVDNNDFRPISFAEVKAKIEAQVEAARKKAGIAVNGTGGKRRVIFLDTAATPTTAAQKKALKRLEAAATDIVELTVPKGRSVKEAIAERVALLSGNVRYVYIGPGPLEDIRAVIVHAKTGITEAAVDTAIKLLSSV